jgi:hypothetical protein
VGELVERDDGLQPTSTIATSADVTSSRIKRGHLMATERPQYQTVSTSAGLKVADSLMGVADARMDDA